MKKIFFRITLLPVLILFAAASVSSAGILFYDDFNDTVYTDKWEVLHQSSLTTITEFGTNCTRRTHEPLFQQTIREAGLNRCLIEMVNI